MNLQSDPNRWAVTKFGVGQPVRRSEDPKLVRGEGRFTDDVDAFINGYITVSNIGNG